MRRWVQLKDSELVELEKAGTTRRYLLKYEKSDPIWPDWAAPRKMLRKTARSFVLNDHFAVTLQLVSC